MASAEKEQATLLREISYLTALIKQHKEPQPSSEVKDGTKQLHKASGFKVHLHHGSHQAMKTSWTSHENRERNETEVSGIVRHLVKKSSSVPTVSGPQGKNKNPHHRKHDSTLSFRTSSGENKCKREQITKHRVKLEPAEPRVKLKPNSVVELELPGNCKVKREHIAEHRVKREQNVQVMNTGHNTSQKNLRTVISKYSGGDFSSIDERKLSFDDKSIKVSIKNEFSEPLKRSRTVLAPTKHSGLVPSVQSKCSSSVGSAVSVTNDPPSNQARKSLSKYKWFGARQFDTVSQPSGMCKSSTSSLINARGSGQNVLPLRTVIAPVEQNKIDSILPKPLMTSTPDDVLLLQQQAPRIPLRRRSSERHKQTLKQSSAKVISSKYRLHKIGPQISSPPVPLPSTSRKIQRQKSLTLVKSRTKLVKKHIPISESSTPRPLLKRNTKYKYQVAHKHSESDSKQHTETPRSHKVHLGKPKSSRYRYVRSLSNSSSKSQRNWKSKYSLKRDNDTAMLIYLTHLLGRPVKNISNNKYKFVSAASNPNRITSRDFSLKRVKTLPSKSKLKLDRRMLAAKTKSTERYVVLNGFVYRSSARKLEKTQGAGAMPANRTKKTVVIRKINHAKMKMVTVNGVKFRMDQSGKTLQRIDSNTPVKTNVASMSRSTPASRRPITRLDIGGVTYYQSRPGTLVRATNLRNRIVASQVVHRSKSWAVASKQRQMKRQYCLYYQRFGRCNRGDKCPSIHDPEKVAVCKRFLRGTCNITDCPFSHKLSKEKMPVCSYFLRGVCTREHCPYLHVKVNQDAEVCNGFLAGYCPLGDKCKKKHTLVCQSFLKTGKCSVGKKCKLVHPNIRKRQLSSSTYQRPTKRRALATEVAQSDRSTTPVPESSATCVRPSVSKKLESMPAFIALEPDKEEVTIPVRQEMKPEKPMLQIRPNFT
ncbi:uncharacterized protein LOC135495801 isoform X2 [Lineus longissimus]|uniref:uncharacterized protein LOC135495801 isoform X2 n=1 Tax=Lineus longissimus TaxID=88925 RepID=UPI002B4F82F0